MGDYGNEENQERLEDGEKRAQGEISTGAYQAVGELGCAEACGAKAGEGRQEGGFCKARQQDPQESSFGKARQEGPQESSFGKPRQQGIFRKAREAGWSRHSTPGRHGAP
jgi:hypothetical protein